MCTIVGAKDVNKSKTEKIVSHFEKKSISSVKTAKSKEKS